MKKTFLLLCVFFAFVMGYAQKMDFEIDFFATYFAPKSNDTIKIGVGSNGKYLFTDSKQVAKTFGSILNRFQPATGREDAKLKLLMDMSTNHMLMHVTIGSNVVLANIGLDQFMNQGKSVDTTITKLQAVPNLYRTISLNNEKYKIYGVAPDDKPDDVVYMAFDKKYPVYYNSYFSSILSSAAGEIIDLNLPEGVVVYIEDKKGAVILELLSIEKKKIKSSVNLDFALE